MIGAWVPCAHLRGATCRCHWIRMGHRDPPFPKSAGEPALIGTPGGLDRNAHRIARDRRGDASLRGPGSSGRARCSQALTSPANPSLQRSYPEVSPSLPSSSNSAHDDSATVNQVYHLSHICDVTSAEASPKRDLMLISVGLRPQDRPSHEVDRRPVVTHRTSR